MTDKKRFVTVTVSTEDFEKYDKVRKEFEDRQAKNTGVRARIGVGQIISVGMTFWLQRRDLEKK